MADDLDVEETRCPDCGLEVPSLDEPCPNCAATPDDEVVPYEYYKTIKNRYLFVYRPERFLESVNDWLASERGLHAVTMTLHYDGRQGFARAVTFKCVGINKPTGRLFRLDRLIVDKGTFSRFKKTLGEVLNSWKEQHPDRLIVSHWNVQPAGVVAEAWILSVGVAPAPMPSPESRVVM